MVDLPNRDRSSLRVFSPTNEIMVDCEAGETWRSNTSIWGHVNSYFRNDILGLSSEQTRTWTDSLRWKSRPEPRKYAWVFIPEVEIEIVKSTKDGVQSQQPDLSYHRLEQERIGLRSHKNSNSSKQQFVRVNWSVVWRRTLEDRLRRISLYVPSGESLHPNRGRSPRIAICPTVM